MSTLIDAIETLDMNIPFTLDAPQGDTIAMAQNATAPQFELSGNDAPRHVLDVSGATNTWVPICGLSNQYGYDGPLLHSSEQLSEDIIQEIRDRDELLRRQDNQPLWVIAEVIDPDDPEALVGWILALALSTSSTSSTTKEPS